MKIEQLNEISKTLEEEGPTIADQMLQMIEAMETLRQTAIIQKADVIQLMDLSCKVILRTQKQAYNAQQKTIETINCCAEYREQVKVAVKANGDLALILFQQAALPFQQEGNA